jgi:hypothetical protein
MEQRMVANRLALLLMRYSPRVISQIIQLFHSDWD